MYLEIGEKEKSVKALDELDELIALFKPPHDSNENLMLIKQKLSILRPRVDAAKKDLEAQMEKERKAAAAVDISMLS
jgi:hypothetical protein